MARSSTSFKPGNRARAKPGNKLAVKHGAYSMELVLARQPEIRAMVEAKLASSPFWQDADEVERQTYTFLGTQAWMWMEHFNSIGGMFNYNGTIKEGGRDFLAVVKELGNKAKILGIGANPRTQVMQGMANTGKELVLIKAAQERMRARLLDG